MSNRRQQYSTAAYWNTQDGEKARLVRHATEARSLTALGEVLASHLSPVDVCDAAELAVEQNWPEGLALIIDQCRETLAGWPQWLSRSLSRATHNPTLMREMLRAGHPRGGSRGQHFFQNDGHAIGLAAALCTSQQRDALYAILEHAAPDAARDFERVLANGNTMAPFLKALAARWKLAGEVPDACLDFMAGRLLWRQGSHTATAAILLAMGDTFGGLEGWQAFLDRHPAIARGYTRDLATGRGRDQVLKAIDKYAPASDQMAWLRDAAARLPHPPPPVANRRGPPPRLETTLVATWTSLRLEASGLAPRRRRRA